MANELYCYISVNLRSHLSGNYLKSSFRLFEIIFQVITLIVLAVQWFVKYFVAPNSPLFWKSGGETKKREAIPKFLPLNAIK